MLGLIPVINFFVVLVFVSAFFFDTCNIGKLLLEPKPYSCKVKLPMFLLFLPWNLTLIGIVLALSAIPAVLVFPLMVIPSYILNIKSYFGIMGYWWSGNRFKDEVKEDLITNTKT